MITYLLLYLHFRYYLLNLLNFYLYQLRNTENIFVVYPGLDCDFNCDFREIDFEKIRQVGDLKKKEYLNKS